MENEVNKVKIKFSVKRNVRVGDMKQINRFFIRFSSKLVATESFPKYITPLKFKLAVSSTVMKHFIKSIHYFPNSYNPNGNFRQFVKFNGTVECSLRTSYCYFLYYMRP
ncbi:hypothetical protein EGR_03453 [Echinococcus granulosus]|uniref:Uncharacterized protein n=1 Tax=Echinococcus granulosus TaxID=6210 RepID=W6V5M9_ECHGR|nr:hypothetical protein EGR_03453 [Echinococcus granulosus]EUB61639.1 hypothetical protein EGR_03453 [Echinococcus granulosus]